MTTVAPFGSWASPITTDLLVEKVVGLGYPLPAGEALYWVESRASEAGRYVIVRRSADGTIEDVLPGGFSARTLVHEYGGLCYAVDGDTVYFSNFDDQRIYRIAGGGLPEPITPEPPKPRSIRYADHCLSPDRRWLVCVRERHTPDGVINELAAVPTDGSAEPHIVAGGHDFFAFPRLSPDGQRLAWITWEQPQMPWDGTDLWEAGVDGDMRLTELPYGLGAGGTGESVTQPSYYPDGVPYWICDRTGWWNLWSPNGHVAPKDAEFAGPDWVFGQSSYCVLHDGTIVATWSENGLDRLGFLPPWVDQPVPGESLFEAIDLPYTSIGAIRPFGDGVVAIAGSAAEAPAIVEISIPSGEHTMIKRSRESGVDPGYLSAPQPIEFPTEGGLTAHALLYPPANREFEGPPGEQPPLIVISHGGPTSATSSTLNYSIQFWTSRGIGVVDVNYGGSTGYGRPYRERLKGAWGVVDVDDCVNAARYLAGRGDADPHRLIIRGGSAGGYTTLCALTFREVFACGASHYGVADAGALARDTHKFEARYLDGLIGPWPEAKDLYEERSPVFHTDRLKTPVILFQGLEDKVVPPDQAEKMAAALRQKGVPFAHVVYPDEQHGFRNAVNIKRTFEAELYFYGRILGFTPAGDLQPVEIENLPA